MTPDRIDTEAGPMTRGAVIDGYLRFGRALRVKDEEALRSRGGADVAARDAFEETIRTGPAEVAWELVRELLRGVPDDELTFHAAGPLEDLLFQRGAEVVEWVEEEARRDARFRGALGAVWLSEGEVPPEVLERVVRASEGAIQPFRESDAATE